MQALKFGLSFSNKNTVKTWVLPTEHVSDILNWMQAIEKDIDRVKIWLLLGPLLDKFRFKLKVPRTFGLTSLKPFNRI